MLEHEKVEILELCKYLSGKHATDNLLDTLKFVPHNLLQFRTLGNIVKMELLIEPYKELKVYNYIYKCNPNSNSNSNSFSVISESENFMLVFHIYNLGIGRTLFKIISKRLTPNGNVPVFTLVSIDIGKLTSDKLWCLKRLENWYQDTKIVKDFKNLILNW